MENNTVARELQGRIGKRILLTTAQAAELLDKSPTTLSIWRCRRYGPAYFKMGGRTIRYDLSDLESWMDGVRIDSEA